MGEGDLLPHPFLKIVRVCFVMRYPALKVVSTVIVTLLLVGSVSAKKLKGIDFPKELGSFLYQNSHDYEKDTPGLGKSLAYRTSDGVAATIYVYDMNKKGILEGVEDPFVTDAAIGTANEIGVIGKRENYSDLSISNFTTIAVGAVKMWYSEISFKDSSGNSRNSVAILTGFKGQILKLRITGGSDKEHFDSVIEFFLRDLGSRTLKSKKKRGKVTIQINEEIMGMPNGILYTVYTIMKNGTNDPYSFETERAAMELVALAWADEDDDSEIDRSDVRLGEFYKAYEAGLLNEYIWKFSRNYVWDRPVGLREKTFEKWVEKEMPEHVVPAIFTMN